MRRVRIVQWMLFGIPVLAGCATSYGQAQTALRQGRYTDAVTHFEEVLVREPDRLDALRGLGVAQYKDGAYDDALKVLDRVVARAAKDATARLYLGLSYLQRGEDGPAEEHLTAFRDLSRGSRITAQIDRALKIMRTAPPTEELRGFIAASLEDEVIMQREVREAQLAAERAYTRPPWFGYPRCYPTRRRGFVCF